MDKLIEAVLKWWDEHQSDTVSDGDGDGDEQNVYDEEPEFVRLAKSKTMNIIFDRNQRACFGNADDPDNTPEKLVHRTEEKLKLLGEFCNADSIEYQETDKTETYIIQKHNKTLTLVVHGNHFDGGWLNVNES